MIDEALLQYDYEWREGDRYKAVQIARQYIGPRREALWPYLGVLSVEDLVAEVDALRAAGRVADRIIVDMWVMSEIGPRQITGEAVCMLPNPTAIAGLLAKMGGR